MSDLRGQLQAYIGTLIDETTPVRGEDIIGARPRVPRRRSGPRRRLATAVASAVIIVALTVVIATLLHRSDNSVVSAGPHATRTYQDSANGFSIELPLGWHAARPAGTKGSGPQALVELRSSGHFPTGPPSRCVPVSTHGVTGNLIWIGLSEIRYNSGPLPIRPQSFAPQLGHFDPALVGLQPIGAAYGCPHPATQILFDFTDQQRKFQFQVIAGPEASTGRAYQILDSLRVKSPAQLHRTPSPTVTVPTVLVPFAPPPQPQDVRVLILNASNQPGVEATTANRLRALGYRIIGAQVGPTPSAAFVNSSGQSLTLASCRAGFSATGAEQLAAAAIGTSTISSDTTLQAFIQSHDADCLIIIGQANNTAASPR
jgi:hypothetical protein